MTRPAGRVITREKKMAKTCYLYRSATRPQDVGRRIYLFVSDPGVRRGLVDARDPQTRHALLRQLSAESLPALETRPRSLDLASRSDFVEGVP